MIKKIILLFPLVVGYLLFVFTYAVEFPYKSNNEKNISDVIGEEKVGIIEKKDTIKGIAESYLGEDNVSEIKTNSNSPIIYYVSKVINYFLAILSFIAVIILLYGFSLVFTGKTDEGLKKGMKYIKIATIAIIVIGISWLFSMWIFGIYNKTV